MKFQRKAIVLGIGFAVLTSGAIAKYVSKENSRKDSMTRNLVFTFTQPYTSLDPLDADSINNLRPARMLFATPIHTSIDDKLESFVLENFSYDQDRKIASLKMRTDVKFSDGSIITASDVALAITRMLLARPDFPSIKHIAGKAEWLKEKFPLKSMPAGIKVEGNTISIAYDADVNHPLFRFTLEIFGIVPSRCIDLEKSKIICGSLPTSGPYTVAGSTSDSTEFVLREDFAKASMKWMPPRIRFIYKTIDQELSEPMPIDSETVLTGMSDSTNNDFEKLKAKYAVRYLQRSGIRYLLIHEGSEIFKDKVCRQVFADRYRVTFAKMMDKPELVTSSFWPQMIGGFLDESQLLSTRSYSADDEKRCADFFKTRKFRWGAMRKNKNSFASNSVRQAIASFGVISEPILYDDVEKRAKDFSRGDLDFGLYFSGMWPLDPYGDAEMLFSPGMPDIHKQFQVDSILQSKLHALNSKLSSRSQAEEVNRYLFDDAYFNTYTHMSTFFAAKNGDFLTHIPSAITEAHPWQVFKK